MKELLFSHNDSEKKNNTFSELWLNTSDNVKHETVLFLRALSKAKCNPRYGNAVQHAYKAISGMGML